MANNIPELKVDTALERLAFSYEKLIKDNNLGAVLFQSRAVFIQAHII